MVPAKRHLSSEHTSVHAPPSKVAKYDPEETKINPSTKSSSAYMNDLMEKVATSSNPVEMTSSVLSAIATSDNYELQKRLLDQLTEKVEDQRKLLEKQKQETEDKISQNPNAALSLPNSLGSVPNSSSVSINSLFNNIKNIQIPDNIKDILKSVEEKTAQIEAQQARLRAVSGSMNASMDDDNNHALNCNCWFAFVLVPLELISSVCIIANSSSNKNDYSNKTATNDPRLRTKKLTPPVQKSEGNSSDISPPLPTVQPVASMSQDELLRKAQEQMAALAQMNQQSSPSYPAPQPTATGGKELPSFSTGPRSQRELSSGKSSESRSSMPKISFQWKRKKWFYRK